MGKRIKTNDLAAGYKGTSIRVNKNTYSPTDPDARISVKPVKPENLLPLSA